MPCLSPGTLTQGVSPPVVGMDRIVKRPALTVIFEPDSQAEALIFRPRREHNLVQHVRPTKGRQIVFDKAKNPNTNLFELISELV